MQPAYDPVTSLPAFWAEFEAKIEAVFPDEGTAPPAGNYEAAMAAFERGLTVEQAFEEQRPFLAFLHAINASCPNYSHKDARKLYSAGTPPEQAVIILNQMHREQLERPLPFDPLDHDYSMNG